MQRKLNTKVVMLIMLIITILTITKTVLFLKNKGEERREIEVKIGYILKKDKKNIQKKRC